MGPIIDSSTMAIVSLNASLRSAGSSGRTAAAKSLNFISWSTLTTAATGASAAYTVTTAPPRECPITAGSWRSSARTTAARSAVIASAL